MSTNFGLVPLWVELVLIIAGIALGLALGLLVVHRKERERTSGLAGDLQRLRLRHRS